MNQICIDCNLPLPNQENAKIGDVYVCPCGQRYQLKPDRVFFPTLDNSVLWMVAQLDNSRENP